MIMADEFMINMMTKDFILWRCLHGGPLSNDTINQWQSDTKMPWERYHNRNEPLLKKLTDIYGACAIVAHDKDKIVGQLRFYPLAVWEMEGAGMLCLQQDFPAGPVDDFYKRDFPTVEEIEDLTLKVHCMMTGPFNQKENPYRRKGLGTRMVHTLIEWARENGWKRIEADSFVDLPIIYEITGSTGYTFWKKLGFHVADRFPHPCLNEHDEFFMKVEEQAKSLGIKPEQAKDSIIMRLDLTES